MNESSPFDTCTMLDAVACGEPLYNVVTGVMHPDQPEPIWIEMSAVPRMDAEGRLVGIIVISADITARRRSEATNTLYAELMLHLPIGFTAWHADDMHDAYSLLMFPLPDNTVGVLSEDITDRKRAADAAELMRAIVESSSDAIIGTSLDGTITSWNGGAEHLTGYAATEAIGRPPSFLLPPDRRDEFPAIMRRLRTGESISQFQTTRVRKDGTPIAVELTISAIKDEQGRMTGAASIGRDITGQKQAAERIRRQLDQLSALRAIDVSITGSYDLRVSLDVVLEQVVACLGVDAAAVLLLDPATQLLTHAASRGFRGTAVGKSRIRLGEGLAGTVALDRRRMGMPDLPVERFIRVTMLQEERFVSYFAVPLLNKGQVLGVLELFTRTRLDPDEEWYAFFDAVGGQAAIAVGDAAHFVDLQRTNLELRLAYDATIEGWSRALDLRDRETEGHSRRVTEMTLRLARKLGFRAEDLIHVRRGALLHDIGKLGVPDGILLKPGPLTEEEWTVMRQHPVYAYNLLHPIKYLLPALDIPYCHHEKWDGSGYPRGLRGTQIPLAARIFTVVDVWDALSSRRPYRDGWPAERVREHIAAGAGLHFDAEVVTAFRSM